MLNNPYKIGSMDDQEIIRRTIQIYHEHLKETPKIQKFLTEKNWLTAQEIATFQIGYSAKALKGVIPENGVIRGRLKEVGFLNFNNNEYFQAHIIFPVIDQFGLIRDVIGFKYQLFKEETSRIKYLRKKPFVKVDDNIRDIIRKLGELRLKSDEEIKQENDLFFQYDKRTYRIRGLSPANPGKLKVNIMVSQDEISHIDSIDLFSSKARKSLINQITEKFNEDFEVIDKEISSLIKRLDGIRIKMKTDDGPEPPPVITEQEKKQITELLEKADILKLIRDDLTKLGIAGEDKNKVMLYMTFTSRKLRKPLSIIIKGDSAGGKSYLTGQVLRLFPDEDIKNFTEISAKSLFYLPPDALEHKILVIFERHGSESSDYSIRSLQSENKLKLAVTMRDPKTSEFKTVEKTVKGPISYAETTTKLNIHAENETRVFNLFIDESTEQTKKIFNIQDLEYLPEERTNRELIEGIVKKHHLIQRILNPVNVIIPYVRQITFPADKLRLRRDRARFLALIETFAFLYQFQREKTQIKGKEYIIADISDYRMAYNLAEDIMKETLSVLYPKTRELLDHISEIEKKTFSISDIQNTSGWNTMRIRRYLKQLIEEDYIDIRSSNQGKRTLYSLCSDKKDKADILEGLPDPNHLKVTVTP